MQSLGKMKNKLKILFVVLILISIGSSLFLQYKKQRLVQEELDFIEVGTVMAFTPLEEKISDFLQNISDCIVIRNQITALQSTDKKDKNS